MLRRTFPTANAGESKKTVRVRPRKRRVGLQTDHVDAVRWLRKVERHRSGVGGTHLTGAVSGFRAMKPVSEDRPRNGWISAGFPSPHRVAARHGRCCSPSRFSGYGRWAPISGRKSGRRSLTSRPDSARHCGATARPGEAPGDRFSASTSGDLPVSWVLLPISSSVTSLSKADYASTETGRSRGGAPPWRG